METNCSFLLSKPTNPCSAEFPLHSEEIHPRAVCLASSRAPMVSSGSERKKAIFSRSTPTAVPSQESRQPSVRRFVPCTRINGETFGQEQERDFPRSTLRSRRVRELTENRLYESMTKWLSYKFISRPTSSWLTRTRLPAFDRNTLRLTVLMRQT